MLLLNMFHSDPALAAVVIFGGIVGALLANPLNTSEVRSQRQRPTRR